MSDLVPKNLESVYTNIKNVLDEARRKVGWVEERNSTFKYQRNY